MSISEKLVGLRIATRKATMCEDSSSGKNTIGLKTKILFLIRNQGLSPSDIMNQLMMVKTNLALLTGEMVKQELIIKQKSSVDKREIVYIITDKGLAYLEKRLNIIEETVAKALPASDEYIDALRKLDDALNALDFIL